MNAYVATLINQRKKLKFKNFVPLCEVFGAYTVNTLKKGGINRMEDLLGKSASEMLKISGLGAKTYKEIRIKMKDYGVEIPET